MQNRLKRLYKSLKRQNLNALLVSNLTNIKYLTGFRGSSGYLLVLGGDAYLYVDSRYYESAGKETNGVKVCLIDDRWPAQLLKFRIKNLGFEAESVLYSVYLHWKKSFKGITLVPTRTLVEHVRMVKEKEEILAIRTAVKFTDQLAASLKIREGVTEIALCQDVENRMRHLYGANPSFNTIVAFGLNSSMPHARPTRKKLGKKGIVLVDMGMFCDEYSSDLTRTFLMGKITEKFKRIYSIVLTAQRLAIESIKIGKPVKDVDSIARNYIKDKGFGKYFGHSLGHGIGLSVHELPKINWKSEEILQGGMVFSVEPGIYLPGWGGVRIEDLVLVTKDGCEVLSKSPKELEDVVF